MPPRRRPIPLCAAALPASRLPLGTPQLSAPKSPASARASSKTPPSPRSQGLDGTCEKGSSPASEVREATHHFTHESATLPTNTSARGSAMSIAQSKLERQRKRIEEAEASLTSQPALDRRGQTSRGKARQWVPLDLGGDSPRPSTPGEGGVPVSEVRVNVFRAPSRASSLARSMSVLSHCTSETGPSDMERQDSGLTDNGFQLYKGRRNKRNAGELSAYEDKPEQRQTTVEATFDPREIYNVFGNALPAPEFMEQNPGIKNGQLQFCQHPNGDVSAHQWSVDRFLWENIGQFSNIRKKIEGQLASDRLKGETAYQTLQQNTLAYFRITAKQREANVMGLPFGAREVQAAIPEPREEQQTAFTGLKELPQGSSVAMPQHPSETATHKTHMHDGARLGNDVAEMQARHGPYPAAYVPSAYVPQGPRSDRYNFTTSYGPQYNRQDDPFYSGGTYQQAYGGYPYGYPYFAHGSNLPSARPYHPTPAKSHGLNYDFHFPPASGTGRSSQAQRPEAYIPDRIMYAGKYASRAPRQSQQSHDSHTAATRDAYYHHPTTQASMQNMHSGTNHDRAPATEVVAPQPTHAPTQNLRSAARDQLFKLPETAKERSISQANIRTVLYDPFQSQRSATHADQEDDQTTEDLAHAFSHNVTGSTLQPPSSFDPRSSKFFPTVLAPQIDPRSSPVGSSAENNLRDSSPDPYPSQQAYFHGTPLVTTSSESKPTPQLLNSRHFGDERNVHSSTESPFNTNRPTEDEQPRDWWTSGNNFVRQEEFYQSIKSASKEPQIKLSTPPAHLTPIGPPSRTPKKECLASFNEETTRLLIPMLENLTSYVQGPVEKRRDYFSQWSQAPEWCIDRSEGGNDSFFDKDWGTPPARVGRDPRYNNRIWSDDCTPQRGRYCSSGSYGTSVGISGGLDRRFAYGGKY